MHQHGAEADRRSPSRTSSSRKDCERRALPASIQQEVEEHFEQNDASYWSRVVHQPCFEIFFAFVIVLNAVQMGTSVEFPEAPLNHIWAALEHFFTAVFFLEMVLKMVGLGRDYFTCHWNKLDFTLVWIAVVDNWVLSLLFDSSNMEHFTVFRIFRLLRIGRMFKMLRLNREIMVLLEGIFASLRSMISVGILLSIIIYACSLFCREMMGTGGLAEGESWDSTFYFGTLPRAWLTLFDMVILVEWAEVARPLANEHPWMVVILAAFVMLNAFGIMNVIIGVLMERTDLAIQQMKQVDMARRRRGQIQQVQYLAGLVASDFADSDSPPQGDATFTPDCLDTEGMRDAFSDIGLPRNFTSRELHIMLDRDGSGHITVNEFILSMWRLIYSDDFQLKCLQQMSVNLVMQQVNRLSTSMDKQFDAMQQVLKEELHTCHEDLAQKMEQLSLAVGAKIQVADLGEVRQRGGDRPCVFDEFADLSQNYVPPRLDAINNNECALPSAQTLVPTCHSASMSLKLLEAGMDRISVSADRHTDDACPLSSDLIKQGIGSQRRSRAHGPPWRDLWLPAEQMDMDSKVPSSAPVTEGAWGPPDRSAAPSPRDVHRSGKRAAVDTRLIL